MDIKEKSQLESLSNITGDYDYSLIDNCSFQQVLSGHFVETLEEKLKRSKLKEASLDFWQNNLKFYKNLYTTQGVVDELVLSRHYNYKKSIKKHIWNKNHSTVLKLQRSLREIDKKRHKLLSYIEEEKRIIKLEGIEKFLFEQLYKKHFGVKNYYNLSDVDFDLLISGMALSQAGKSSAIVSNDFGIVKAWKYLLNKREFSLDDFGFFIRQEISLFKRLK